MAGDDFSNRQQRNFVFQNASSDVERGLPAVGKVVYRTDTDGLELCSDTTPDPLENGGGTWTALGGATWQNYTPAVTSTGTAPNLGSGGGTSGRYTQLGKLVIANVFFDFSGTGISAGTGTYLISVPVTIKTSPSFIRGFGVVYDNNTFQETLGYVRHNSSTTVKLLLPPSGILSATSFTYVAGTTVDLHLEYEAA